MSSESFYPPSPANVDPRLTRTPWGFRLRVLAVIAALFGFLILYVLIAAAAAAGAWWLLQLPVSLGSVSPRAFAGLLVLKYGGAVALATLWIFLFKGLFKYRRISNEHLIQIKEEQFPILFNFIRRVAKDVRSSMPRQVFVDPYISAALVYNSSLVNLILPPRKNMIIGLGLVQALNLVEFKGVIAHECAHFTQGGFRLDAYMNLLVTVVRDLVKDRDWLDELIDDLCEWELPTSRWTWGMHGIMAPFWALKGLLWCIRGFFTLLMIPLFRLNASLSRQAELRADSIAVSVVGSDAVAHGLMKMQFAALCLKYAGVDLLMAAKAGLYSPDIYYHMSVVAERIRNASGNPRLGLAPKLPTDVRQTIRVFKAGSGKDHDPYSSHPSHYEREVNAKRYYVRGPEDDRSAWLLFGNATGVKKWMSHAFYEKQHGIAKGMKYSTPQEVQTYIDNQSRSNDEVPEWNDESGFRLSKPDKGSSPAGA